MKKVSRVWIWLCDDSCINISIYWLKTDGVVFSGGILSFLEHMDFNEGLAPFFSACEAKPTISSMRPWWSNTRSMDSHPMLSARVQEEEEHSYGAKGLPSVSASMEGRIGWISLCQNQLNASESPCLESEGMQS